MSGARTTGVKRRKRTVADLERENARLRDVIKRIAAAVDDVAMRERTADMLATGRFVSESDVYPYTFGMVSWIVSCALRDLKVMP